MNPKVVLKSTFCFIGIVFLLMGLNDLLNKKDLFFEGIKITGVVSNKILTKFESENYKLEIDYLYNGLKYKYTSNSYGYEYLKVGNKIELLMSPKNPVLCRINNFEEMYQGFMFMLIVPIGYTFYKLWFPKNGET